MWLEIEDELVIGVHSDKCISENKWVEYDDQATPGDKWIDGKLIKNSETVPDSITGELSDEQIRRIMAKDKILMFYPLWKQLNILRECNIFAISKMGSFIDACRNWSNDLDQPESVLDEIEP